LTVTGAENGAMVCGREIDGHATFASTGVGVQLGASGSLDECDLGPTAWGGNVLGSGTTGAVAAADHILRGNLEGTGNDSVSAGDIPGRGVLKGRVAERHEPSRLQLQRQAQPGPAAEAGRQKREDLRTGRLNRAEKLAEAAGPANL